MYASRFVLGAFALSLLIAGFGCKTGKAGKVPVTSPMVTFTAPDRDEVFPEEDAETDAADATDDAGDGN